MIRNAPITGAPSRAQFRHTPPLLDKLIRRISIDCGIVIPTHRARQVHRHEALALICWERAFERASVHSSSIVLPTPLYSPRGSWLIGESTHAFSLGPGRCDRPILKGQPFTTAIVRGGRPTQASSRGWFAGARLRIVEATLAFESLLSY